MKLRWQIALFTTLMLLNPLMGTNAMDQIDNAVGHLINSNTAANEKRAAEELIGLLRAQRVPLNLTVYDRASGQIVPLNSLGQSSSNSLEVELSAASDPPVKARRWRPKQIQNIFILLRE